MTNKKELTAKILDAVILVFLAGLFIMDTCFGSWFPKIHLKLPFLDFPIFTGEIGLFIALVLFSVRIILAPIKWSQWHWAVVGYFVFVVVKALYGYSQWGALAFRNAAMFYYPLFAVITCYVYRAEFFRNKIVLFSLVAGTIVLMLSRSYGINNFLTIDDYWMVLMCFLVCALRMKKPWLRYVLIISLLLYSLLVVELSARSILISVVCSIVFLLFTFTFCFLNFPIRKKMVIFLCLIAAVVSVLYGIADRTAIKSFIYLKEYVDLYQDFQAYVKEGGDFEHANVKVRLYEKTKTKNETNEDIILARLEKQASRISLSPEPNIPKQESGTQNEKISITRLELQERTIKRSLGSSKHNVVWRMIVWADMFTDLKNSKKIFGIDFGYPFRSRTIEAINYVLDQDWSFGREVGWVEPHNSFIHILYRSGIVGVFFICFLFGYEIVMVRDFVRHKNISGILLCSGVLFWLIYPNFSVVLELPYFAIPFWTFFGLVCGYHRSCTYRRLEKA